MEIYCNIRRMKYHYYAVQPTTGLKKLKDIVEGSHTFTDKKIRRLFQDLQHVFQDLIGAHQRLNIKKNSRPDVWNANYFELHIITVFQ